jgi:hypothetical protein
MRLIARLLDLRSLILAGALAAGVLAASPASASPAPATTAVVTSAGAGSATASLCPDADTATFGPNVCVFKPAMSVRRVDRRLRRA